MGQQKKANSNNDYYHHHSYYNNFKTYAFTFIKKFTQRKKNNKVTALI